MKKILLIIVICIAITSCSVSVNIKASAACFTPTESQRTKDELIITLLTPEIEKAITNYYGEYRRYEIGDSKIEILQRGDGQNFNVFKVAVKIDTFEGPHNNYFTELLTFTITPTIVTLDHYRHSDFIPNNEYIKETSKIKNLH